MDETGLITVPKRNTFMAAKGKCNVDVMTFGERATNVTMVNAMPASENTVPTMFAFPRKIFKSYFINNGVPHRTGAGNASGWVTDDEFFQFMHVSL